MPEGVEVKLSADTIRPLLLGKEVYHISVGDKSRYKNDLPEGMLEFPKRCRITSVATRGKFMYWSFDNGWYLLNTFGMSGQWSPVAGKHPCLIVQLEGGQEEMVFNDQRHFGTIKFTNESWVLLKKKKELGWDPLQDDLEKNFAFVAFQLRKSSKNIGEVLMDQSIFAGVGNYIRAEALYLSKLNPFRAANKLSADENRRLCQAILDVMQESYKYQGATIQTYKTAYGEEGKYSSCFKVYGQKQDPLGNPIITQDSGGRTLHWCPTIQEGQ